MRHLWRLNYYFKTKNRNRIVVELATYAFYESPIMKIPMERWGM